MDQFRRFSNLWWSFVVVAVAVSEVALAPLTFALELTRVALEQRALKIQFTSSGQCSWGDLDLIALELREHRQKNIATRLLVSVEALDGSVVAAKEFDIAGFVEGQQNFLPAVIIPLASVNKPTPVGIFVCKDSSGMGGCRSKKIQDFNEVFSRHLVPFQGGENTNGFSPDMLDPTTAGEDVLYYFQPAILTPDGLMVVGEDFTEGSLAEFERVLESRYGATPSSLETVRHGVSRVRSGLVMVPKTGITIDLPSSDQSRCVRELAEEVAKK